MGTHQGRLSAEPGYNCQAIQMKEVCSQHGNTVERICLNQSCNDRGLCLLCDHLHGSPFQSIMTKTTESQKTFQHILNQAIDLHLLQEQNSSQHQILLEQTSLISKYFRETREELSQFLQSMQTKIIKMLRSEDQEIFALIKRARIENTFLKLPPQIFQILLQIYEGTPLQQIFKKNETGKTEQAYHRALTLHQRLAVALDEQGSRFKTKLPDIRRVLLRESHQLPREEEAIYDLDIPKAKYTVRMTKQSAIQFDSIVSDCQRMRQMLVTTCFDKKIRVVDCNLELKGEHQFTNILTRIHEIGEDVFACAHSKELLIENIRYDQSLHVEDIMRLRGHSERINDIHSLNTRIIASSSSEGVKVWDLYKQKCQYTLRQQTSPSVIRFVPANTLLVGYDNHTLAVHSVQTMKVIQKYSLKGVPLLLDQGKFTQHELYLAGFPSTLAIVDTRMNSLPVEINLGQAAVTAVADSIYDQHVVATGDRDGFCNLLEMRTRRPRTTWKAHSAKGNMSRPRGVLGIFQRQENVWMTVGCDDRCLRMWQIEKIQKQF